MDVIKTLTGLIKDVDNNDIDSLKDLYLELIYLRSELQAINYTHSCEEFADGKCRPMVNADWTYLRCECGKRFKPKG
jgi:hypothetical protein